MQGPRREVRRGPNPELGAGEAKPASEGGARAAPWTRTVGRSPNKRCKGGRRKDPAQGTCWRRGRVRPWPAPRLTAAQLES